MIDRHLDSFAGLNGKESKTDLDSDLWEEVPCYVFDRDARGDPGIVWDAQEYPSTRGQEYVEVALIADG